MRRTLRRRASSLILPLLAGWIAAVLPLRGLEPPPRLAFQIADLGTEPPVGARLPFALTAVGGRALFTAADDVHGVELWATDGTPAGTAILADLCPGACSSYPRAIATVDGLFVFIAQDGSGSSAVWRSDGTPEGTTVVSRQGLVGGPNRAVLDGRIYLGGEDREHGSELWTTAGTAESTRLVADLCPGDCSSVPVELTALGDLFLFVTAGRDVEHQVWRSDGTAAGTFPITEACSACSSAPGGLLAAGGRVYFTADDGVHGPEPWVTDGTARGTRLLHDLLPGPGGSNPYARFSFAGSIYFRLLASGGFSFWRIDRPDGGPEPATELFPYGPTVGLRLVQPAAGRLFFSLRNPHSHQEELWVVDGPGPPARRLGIFTRVVGTGAPPAGGRVAGAELGDEIVFGAIGPVGEPGLWASDGSPEGTRRIRLFSGPSGAAPTGFLPADGRLVFSAFDDEAGAQLWRTDGTTGGTVRASDVPAAQASSFPGRLTAVGPSVYFQVEHVPSASGLWRTTGPAGGAERVIADRAVGEPTALGERLFFLDSPGRFPAVLSERATEPTVLSDTGAGRQLTAVGDHVFFAAGEQGQQLWVSDGTREGTRRIADARPGWVAPCDILPPCPQTFPTSLTAAGERLFFVVAPEDERELWVSDGTPEGTGPVPGAPFGAGETASLGDDLVFLVPYGTENPDLWRTDGTADGTVRVLSFPAGSVPNRLVAAEGFVYFLVGRADRGPVLWRTDGTPPGTFPLLDLGVESDLGPNEMVTVGRSLFFTHVDGATGEELWTSDGTPAGTRRVVDLFSGQRGSNPSALTAHGDLLLFTADDGVVGHEPWISDGTAAGTFLLADVNPGLAPSSPRGFAVAGPWAVFDAHDGATGREPWAARLPGDGALPPLPDSPPLTTEAVPGFRFWVRISDGAGQALPARREERCVPEALCVSGAVPGRSELFVRIVGPKPNGRLWPTLVRFSTSTIDVWIEQLSTGLIRHYRLDGAAPGSSELDGLFDREGFPP